MMIIYLNFTCLKSCMKFSFFSVEVDVVSEAKSFCPVSAWEAKVDQCSRTWIFFDWNDWVMKTHFSNRSLRISSLAINHLMCVCHGACLCTRRAWPSFCTNISSPISLWITQVKDTPLHQAVRCGHIEVCVALLSKGANVNAVNYVSDWAME